MITSKAKKPIQILYNFLRAGNSLSAEDLKIVTENNCTLPQFASLGVFLALKKRNSFEEILLKRIKTFSELSEYLSTLTAKSFSKEEFNKLSILTKISQRIELSNSEMEKLFNLYQENKISDAYMATWLAIVCCKGLAEKNIVKLTEIMRDSGKMFDYRNSPELNYRKIIRRYPTGALSEKIALIMPSLLASLSDKYPLASNFLVAKSLSYTGGTWDKFNSLSNFYFPQQGEETIKLIKEPPHVVMSVTKEDFNPLDRRLYQLRSVTGTVESIPLIISSIASKHLAMPADFLLMDVRYGEGAFLKSKQEAIEMSSLLTKILRDHMDSDFVLNDSQQPTGMSIGNELEIVEALEIMKDNQNKISELWDKRALSEQKKIVTNMLSKMLNHVFSDNSIDFYEQEIDDAFSKGKVIKSFKNLLQIHQVEENFINKLVDNPELLINKYYFFNIFSKREGKLILIDQKSLGMFVNFELQTGLNDCISPKRNGGGIILKVRVGDNLKIGDTLCVLLGNHDYIEKNKIFLEEYLTEMFKVYI